MLEYFTYKKVKKHQAEKEHSRTPRPETIVQERPIISEEDENFLSRIISEEGTPPALPERPHGLGPLAGEATGNKSQVAVYDGRDGNDKRGKEKEKEEKKGNKISGLYRTFTRKGKGRPLSPDEKVVTPNEAASETDDINRILEDLNLSAVNNRVFSMSKSSQEVVGQFTIVLKDLVNGVPTAYDDLVDLLNDSDGTLAKSYDSLPSFLQKLVTSLPTKLTGTLAPELLAVATEAQAFSGAGGAAGAEFVSAAAAGGVGGAAKGFLKISTLKDLVTKPGAVVSMLKYIMNALKLRWPAFMGTNVLLSLGLFVLLFFFWYCHKRGKQVRLERENPKTIDSEGRIVELDDDPMLGPSTRSRSKRDRDDGSYRSHRSYDDRSDHGRRDRDEHSDAGERREHRDRRDHDARSSHGSRRSSPREQERREAEEANERRRKRRERHEREKRENREQLRVSSRERSGKSSPRSERERRRSYGEDGREEERYERRR